ncbi:DUF4303 domain-containing protein [Streptomyces sp. NPDC047515]|uniref:DUF4303 domain-containing protein n=1 Tax=Streptomyces sp. NPDC047515 TaxID=3155380 RepID=UPI0033E68003
MLELGSLRAEVLRAARAAFKSIVGTQAEEDYCGFALYSDADAVTVCCSVNTRAHLARAQAEDPDNSEYYLWSPAEWALEGIGHEHFAALCRRLFADGEEYVQRREAVYEACVTALESLVDDGVFGTGTEHVVVFAVSDFEDPVREAEWIRRLNPPGQAGQFARWLHAASPHT